MNYTLFDLSSSLLATLCFSLLFVPPGFLFAHVTGILDFPRLSGREKLLWSIVLSLPLSLVLSGVLGRYLSPTFLSFLFLAMAAIAAALILPRVVRSRTAVSAIFNQARGVLFALVGIPTYILASTCSLQWRNKLYESVYYIDWCIRLPLISSAVRNGVPPGNPFFTINAHPGNTRYYFYWYALCAQVGRPLHLGARACLAASAIWSALALVAVLLLFLKYLVGILTKQPAKYAFALFLGCISGLDIVLTIVELLLRPPVLLPDPDWWIDDRLPSFLGAIIFAPHHIAGLACCALALLVIQRSDVLLSAGRGQLPTKSRARLAVATILIAGTSFAACAGTSTYTAVCFAVIGILWGLDLLLQHRFHAFGVLCLAGLFAVLISVPLLRELALGQGLGSESGAAHRPFLVLDLRDRLAAGHVAASVIQRSHGRLHHFVRAAIMIVATPIQLGFFCIPLGIYLLRGYRRLRAGLPFTAGERLLGAMFFGSAFATLFISSRETQGTNDMGRHAALCFRFVLIAVSVPILYPYLERLRQHNPLSPEHPWLAKLAMVLLALGLTNQAWELSSNRFLIAFLGQHPRLQPSFPIRLDPDRGSRAFQLRRGLELVGSQLPPSAIIQSNMGDRYQMQVLLYSSHPFAAGDLSCEAAFGGDLRRCTPMVEQLQRLFGSASNQADFYKLVYRDLPLPNPAPFTTAAYFQAVCRDLNLAALVVQDVDYVWHMPDSWVWKLQPSYAASHVRIFDCPASSEGGSAISSLRAKPFVLDQEYTR